METPFTIDQFVETFKNYNQAVFPMQVAFYLIGLVVIHQIVKPSSHSDKIISGLLAFFWLWMGVAYHLIFFSQINKAAYLFGTLFILQGGLFLAYGVFRSKLSFRFRLDRYSITGFILILFALIIYPALGYLLGHIYPYSPTFGLPCPTTIFTLGVLLFIDKKCPLIILVIPFLWSIVGFTAAFNFGIVEDTGLLLAGLLVFIMIVIRNRNSLKENVSISN